MAATPKTDRHATDVSVARPAGGSSSESGATIHPSFTFEDADVVLCSKDGISFQVFRICLRLSSGWFRSLYTLPQNEASSSTETIYMDESSDTLAILLSIAHGQDVPQLKDMDEVESAIHAAEKYDMPGVLNYIRQGLLRFAEQHPVRVYALACRWGWIDEAKVASTHTVKLDLLSSSVLPSLNAMDSADLARLMFLHRQRRDCLRERLDSEEVFYANVVPSRCQNPTCNAEVIHDKWHQLKYHWLTTIDKDPALFSSRTALLEGPEVLDVINFKCARCTKKQYNTESTLTNLRNLLDELPRAVEIPPIQF
ncbi:unnamed protein product [Somion occarium]|uniref:BTB domain-containing protein n=1 Tax=Somion occarium TaxID=3059160 RepID=A0ABP1CJX5_9APHY